MTVLTEFIKKVFQYKQYIYQLLITVPFMENTDIFLQAILRIQYK